jgi:quercetin 2,3-dioxygenase
MMNQETATHLIHDRQDRGHSNIAWLNSYHTFSFGNFYDPNRMGFRTLRVINDDRVTAGAGFGTHGHNNMEIITYVLQGAIEHRDSMGNGTVIYPGEVQIMSAGTGITHSEFNHSKTDPLHFLQIWILPDQNGLKPRYEQRAFPLKEKHGEFHCIAAKNGKDGAVTIHQDVELYAAILESGDVVRYHLPLHRYAWLQIAGGIAELNGKELREGDGVQISGEEKLEVSTQVGAEILLFDLG